MLFYIYAKRPGFPASSIGTIDYSETASNWPFVVDIAGVGKHSHPGVNKADRATLQGAIEHFEKVYLPAWAGGDHALSQLVNGAEVYLSETRPSPAKVVEADKGNTPAPKADAPPSSGGGLWIAIGLGLGAFWLYRRKRA